MPSRHRRFLFRALLPLLLSGCVIVQEQGETVAINGDKLPGSAIPPGQLLNVVLIDGTHFSAAFVELSKTELVTRRRGTFAMETLHTPIAKVSGVSYYRVVGTHTERWGIPDIAPPLTGPVRF